MILDPGFLIVGLTLGFASSLHCIAMCSGIAASLVLGAGPEIPLRVRVARLGAGNLGRLVSYASAGSIAGVFGSGAVAALSQTDGYLFLRFAAAAVLLMTGFSIAGWLPLGQGVAALGWPIWERIAPVARSLKPGGSVFGNFAYGALWGWLPCGMVYSALIYSVFAGSALNGALVMAAFGAGTLPAMLGVGFAADRLRPRPITTLIARQLLGGLAILLAVASVVQGGLPLPFCANPPSP